MAFIQVNFMSNCLARTVTMNAVVPLDRLHFTGEGERVKKPLKTLYLLHGICGNYTDWISGTRIQAWAEERSLAVIMPSGENRFYVDIAATGEMYGEFIGSELVAFTRELFPLSHERSDTYIAGLSMGGYGALRNGLKYAATFGCIAGLSSALIMDIAKYSDNSSPMPYMRRSYNEAVFGDLDKLPGSCNDPRALVDSLLASGKPVPRLYLCCGTEDFLIENNRDFHKFLAERNVEHVYEEGSGTHNWAYWDEHILKVLQWLPLIS